MLPDAKLGIDGLHDVIIESESECFTDLEVVTYFVGGHHSVTPALAEGCLQDFESSGAGRGAPPS